ncbi:hypothetical protein GCM10009810_31410 [Nostocoides vanveenii]|uniref:Uncharacterized protein n=1 Tax=Nostocoides vanveenii TaxID=330835 RepID=A0ABN2L0R8_9MICO
MVRRNASVSAKKGSLSAVPGRVSTESHTTVSSSGRPGRGAVADRVGGASLPDGLCAAVSVPVTRIATVLLTG